MTNIGYDPSGLKLLEAVTPLREHVASMVQEAQRISVAAGPLPDASSPAMAERAKEPEFVGEWSDAPLRLGHTLAGLCLASAEDHLNALVTLLSAPPEAVRFDGPVYAHVTLARAIVETAARAYWLIAPNCSFVDRMSRALAENLYATWERGNATHDRKPYTALRDRTERECIKRNMPLDCRNPRGGTSVGNERRVGNRSAVQKLFQGKPEGFPDLVYGYYSSIAHGVSWGLLESIDVQGESDDRNDLIPARAFPAKSSRHMLVTLAVAADAYRIATDARHEHMGWGSDDWTRLARRLDTELRSLFTPNA